MLMFIYIYISLLLNKRLIVQWLDRTAHNGFVEGSSPSKLIFRAFN